MKKATTKWRGLVVLAGVLIIAGLVLGACGSSGGGGGASPSAAATPKPGGTYVYPIGADPQSIEPLNLQEADAAQITHQVFQGLYMIQEQPDGKSIAVPDLAEKTEMSPDAKTFTFTIKQGVMFAPPVSREVTAQDFYDSWNYVLDPANKSVLSGYLFQNLAGLDPNTGYRKGDRLTSVKVLSKYSFQATLATAFSQFPVTLCNDVTKVFPVDYAKKIGKAAFFEKPVGTGPYMVDSWDHNKSVTIVKNPDYWNKDGSSANSAGPGYVDTISFPVYTDTSTAYLAFQKGTLDFTAIPAGSFISAQSLPDTKSGTWTVKAYPNTGTYFYGIAMKKPILGGSANLPIRVALNYAADRDAVCNIVNQGVPIPNDQIVSVFVGGYKPGLNPYPYDPAKAQPELDKFTAAGGTLPQDIPMWFNNGNDHDKNAQVLVAGWQKAMPALTFKLVGTETAAYWPSLTDHKPPALFRNGWVADYPSIDNFIYLFTTKGGDYGGDTQYSNPEVDRLFAEARAAQDEQTANDLYNQAQILVLTDAPCVPIYSYRDARITNNRIGGFNYNAFALTDMWKLWVK